MALFASRPPPGPPVRIAVAGAGWVAQNRHLPAITASSAFELVGVIDRRAGGARDIARRFSAPRWAASNDLSDVPWLDQVDAVTIATPPDTHAALIRAALEQGKHVLTEKPFTLCVADGEALAELSRSRRLQLAIVHNFQFATSTTRLLDDIARGRLGEIRGVTAVQLSNPRRRLPAWYEDLPFGLFYDESPHLLYLLDRIAGASMRLLRATAVARTSEVATPAQVQALYASARPAAFPVHLSMNFEAPVSEWHLAVFGTRAVGDIDIFRDIYVTLPNDGLHTTSTVVRTSLAATAQHWGQHLTSGARHLRKRLDYGNREVFARFARAIRRGAPPEQIGVAEALRILERQHELIERAERIALDDPAIW